MLQRPALSIRGVTKRFGDFIAVNDLSLDVLPGTCLGLLGPNGAGKTTLMRMITGQTRAASGDISVLEHDVVFDTRAARRVLGVCPQQDNMDDQQTARENLALWAALCRVPSAERRHAVDVALQTAQLTDRANERVTNLSGGMRRRLLLGRAFVNSPKVVLLDEPTVGLDPQVRSDGPVALRVVGGEQVGRRWRLRMLATAPAKATGAFLTEVEVQLGDRVQRLPAYGTVRGEPVSDAAPAAQR